MSEKFMPQKPLETAVLFLVFNRLDVTKQVFEEIRKAKPPRLYIAADGPRLDVECEDKKVQEVRDFMMSNIDWDCEIKTLFRDENLGCKYAVSGAIDWFFDQEEMGIILEDDCLPSQSFFWFCEELLTKYKDDTRIWHIGGTNPIDKELSANSYYFSKYNRIWGWASWARAWNNYDVNIAFWPEMKQKKSIYELLEKKEARKFEKIFDDVYNNKIDTWDYQWFLIRLLNGKAIIPNVNLVSNVGFNCDATHTTDSNNQLSNLLRGVMEFPLVHPEKIQEDQEKDLSWSRVLTRNTSLIDIIFNKLKIK